MHRPPDSGAGEHVKGWCGVLEKRGLEGGFRTTSLFFLMEFSIIWGLWVDLFLGPPRCSFSSPVNGRENKAEERS